jgi:perosamine synthetase
MNPTNISLSGPDIGEEEIEAVLQVLRSPSLSMGPFIQQFESRFSKYLQCRHAAGVSSGTAGLHLCVIAAGIQEGDEVITTPFSFISSANCMLFERAIPKFVDIDPLTMNIDPMRIEDAITEQTKAILPVHAFGVPCDMDRIMEISREYGLIVIEDACEAIGAEWNGKKAGTFGDFGVFAFYPNKQMTTGEGGMIVCDNERHDALFRSLRNQGRSTDGKWLNHIRLGYNYRMDEMSAALGAIQISRIDALLERRRHVAEMYRMRLSDIEGITLPSDPPGVKRSWFVYVIRLDPQYDRDTVMEAMESRGIPTRPYFSPIHLQPFYQERFGFQWGDFPVTESVASSTIALPFHNNLTENEVDYIAETLNEVLRSL